MSRNQGTSRNPDDVQDAIFEEMRAHAAEDMDPPLKFDFEDKAALLKVLKRCGKKAGEKHRKSKLSVSIVKGLWGKTKISIETENCSKNAEHGTSQDA